MVGGASCCRRPMRREIWQSVPDNPKCRHTTKKLLNFSIINFIKHSKAGGEKLHHNLNYEFISLAIQCNTNEGHFPISYFSFSQLKIERCVDPSSTAVGQWKRRGGENSWSTWKPAFGVTTNPPKILMANGFMCEEKTCVFVFVCACVGTQVEADCLHALRQSYSTQEKIQRMWKKLAFVSSAPPPAFVSCHSGVNVLSVGFCWGT